MAPRGHGRAAVRRLTHVPFPWLALLPPAYFSCPLHQFSVDQTATWKIRDWFSLAFSPPVISAYLHLSFATKTKPMR